MPANGPGRRRTASRPGDTAVDRMAARLEDIGRTIDEFARGDRISNDSLQCRIGIGARSHNTAVAQPKAVVASQHFVGRAVREHRASVAGEQNDAEAQGVERALAAFERREALVRRERLREVRQQTLENASLLRSEWFPRIVAQGRHDESHLSRRSMTPATECVPPFGRSMSL